jgi:hypothetical protein
MPGTAEEMQCMMSLPARIEEELAGYSCFFLTYRTAGRR